MQWAEIQALGGVGRADRLLKAAGYNGAYKTVEISRWAKWEREEQEDQYVFCFREVDCQPGDIRTVEVRPLTGEVDWHRLPTCLPTFILR